MRRAKPAGSAARRSVLPCRKWAGQVERVPQQTADQAELPARDRSPCLDQPRCAEAKQNQQRPRRPQVTALAMQHRNTQPDLLRV